jgi:hypothetical protein
MSGQYDGRDKVVAFSGKGGERILARLGLFRYRLRYRGVLSSFRPDIFAGIKRYLYSYF